MTSNTHLSFGDYVRKKRTEQGMTMLELAKKLELKSIAFISEIEQGRRMPALETLPKFAEALGVPVAELETLDTRGPVQEVKSLLTQHPEYAAAFRQVIQRTKELGPQRTLDLLDPDNPPSTPPQPPG